MKQNVMKSIVSAAAAVMCAGVLVVWLCGGADAQDAGPGASWSTFRGNPAHTGQSTLEGPPEEIEMKWRWRVNYDTNPISASPVIGPDGTVYIATEGGYAAAISSGAVPGWVYHLGAPAKSTPAVASDGSVLVVTAKGYAHYFNSRGEVVWKSDLGIGVESSPVISGGTAYVGTNDRSLLALSLTPQDTGYVPESKKYMPWDVITWTFPAYGTVKSSPAFAGNTVLFGGGDYVYAINPTAGTDNGTAQVKWSYNVKSSVRSSPAVYEGRVYVGADDGYLYAFDENPADTVYVDEVWRRKLGGPVASSPAVAENEAGEVMIYVGCDDGRLYAFNEFGELKWTFATLGPVRASPAVDVSGDIYFGSDDAAVYALFPDGSLKWRYQTSGAIMSSPAIGPDKRLYVGSQNGFLYCIGESTRDATKPDLKIDVSVSLAAVENEGNPTKITAAITSEREGSSILSRIASVTLDLSSLNLLGVTDPDSFEVDEIGQVVMLDDGLLEDDVANDGIFTYSFGITNLVEFIGFDGRSYFHFPLEGFSVGPVPLMVTVTDVYGNRVSQPIALNITQKNSGTPAPAGMPDDSPIVISSGLSRQTLTIAFTSGLPSIQSVAPNRGAPGVNNISIVGTNTNFIQNRTRVEIFNETGFRIAFSDPIINVNVLSDTSLVAELNILDSSSVLSGTLFGRWDIVVTTVQLTGEEERVVGRDLYTIDRQVAASMTAPGVFDMPRTASTAAPSVRDNRMAAMQQECIFEVDAVNDLGARARNAPWRINVGYPASLRIEDARPGDWLISVTTQGVCEPLPSYKLVTSASNFGFITGQVRNGFTGQGIDNATVAALTGDLMSSAVNSTITSGDGYYLLPLSAATDSYTVIASWGPLIDIQREVPVRDATETLQNFSLKPDVQCPLSLLLSPQNLQPFYRFRDQVLARQPRGPLWVALYYRHAGEVAELLQQRPALKRDCTLWALRMLLMLLSRDPTPLAGADAVRDVPRLIDDVIEAAGPELQADLGAERVHIISFAEKIIREGTIY